MKKLDRDALARCVEEYCRDPKCAKRFKERVADEGWERAAMSACYSCQMNSMALPPWGCPVCWADGDAMEGSAFAVEQVKAKLLADRMRANGLSVFEPHPIASLQQIAEAKQRTLHVIEPEQTISDSPDAA
jgi:hypothetical protein